MYLGKEAAKESFCNLINLIYSKNHSDYISFEKEIDVLCLYFDVKPLPEQNQTYCPIKEWFKNNMPILTGQI